MLSYKTLFILSGITLMLVTALGACFYVYVNKAVRKDYPKSVYLIQLALIGMIAIGFAIGMFLSSFMNSYTKMIFLTSINENHLVV